MSRELGPSGRLRGLVFLLQQSRLNSVKKIKQIKGRMNWRPVQETFPYLEALES